MTQTCGIDPKEEEKKLTFFLLRVSTYLHATSSGLEDAENRQCPFLYEDTVLVGIHVFEMN